MSCNEVQQYLLEYLDQALTPEVTQRVEAHLFECDQCWQELSVLTDLSNDLHHPDLQRMVLRDPTPLPSDFTDQVMQHVASERPTGLNLVWPWLQRRWSRRQYASVAYAMSATMVVVSAGNLLFLWNQTTNRFGLWMAQGQAYSDALMAYLGGAGLYLNVLWQGTLEFLRLG